MSSPLLSIVVATYNREQYLSGALMSLIAQNTNGDFGFEVVVVDNGSTDGTRTVVTSIAETSMVPLRYVLENRAGVAPARNAGIRAAKGDWLAFFDDDQIATIDWLRYLFMAAETSKAQCIGGAVHIDLSEEKLQQISLSFRKTILREQSNFTGDDKARPYRRNEFPGTGNLLIARSVFDHIGVFDEGLVLGGEDHDLAMRIRRAGYTMWYTPSAIVKHRVFPKRLTPEYMAWDAVQGGAETAHFDHKYRGSVTTFILCLARIGKSITLTLPKFVYARATRNTPAEIACKTSLRRQEGYLRGVLTLFLPCVFSVDSLTQRWAFRKGREIELS